LFIDRNIEVTNATEKAALNNRINELEYQKSRLEREKQQLEGELSASQKEIVGLKCSIAEITSASAGLQAKHDSIQRQLEAETNRADGLDSNLVVANSRIQELEVYFYLSSKIIVFCYLLLFFFSGTALARRDTSPPAA